MGENENKKVNEIIKICVGGQNFKTTRGTLMSDENSLLAKMFDHDDMGRAPAAKDETGAFFIDRSPKYFGSILNFLRTGEIEAPICLDLKFLLLEAEYYGIEGMATKIRQEIQSKQAFEEHMREHCEQLNCMQQCCQNYLSQIAEFTAQQASMVHLGHTNTNLQIQAGGFHHHHFGHPFHHHHNNHHGNNHHHNG